MIALAPRIETRTEARRLADIGPAWCIVARQPTAGSGLLRWRWTLPPAEAKALADDRAAGVFETVTGRGAEGHVLYARRVVAMSAPASGPPRTKPPPEPTTIALAVDLLRKMAEDPLVCPSYRAAARRHLGKLYPRAAGMAAAEGDDDAEAEAEDD